MKRTLITEMTAENLRRYIYGECQRECVCKVSLSSAAY